MYTPGKIRKRKAQKRGIQEITVDKIAVLIPCYNEEKTIGKVVYKVPRIYTSLAY